MEYKLMSFFYTHLFPRGSMFHLKKKRENAKTHNPKDTVHYLQTVNGDRIKVENHGFFVWEVWHSFWLQGIRLGINCSWVQCTTAKTLWNSTSFLGYPIMAYQLRRLHRAERNMQKWHVKKHKLEYLKATSQHTSWKVHLNGFSSNTTQ